MKITHICLAGPFTDDLSYQENLLTKYHKKMGLEVSMITSKFIWNDRGEIAFTNNELYKNKDGVKVIRIDNKFKTNIKSKFKIYKSFFNTIVDERPDILFVHGIQFLGMLEIIKYLEINPKVKLYVDNHADFSNSATNYLSKNILHKIIWKKIAKKAEPFVTKFYGVLPSRVDFLKKIYKIHSSKVELLVLGADDEKLKKAKSSQSRRNIRKKHNIDKNDFLIVTGGKIDNSKKETLLLMEAVKSLNDKKLKLIVFGSVVNEIKEQFNSLIDGQNIIYIGWIDTDESYEYFAASNLVIFPGRHSVYWEQVVALGIPLVTRYWEGTTHIDIGGNVKFLYDGTCKEIKKVVCEITKNNTILEKMIEATDNQKKDDFLYSNIALKSIGLEN